MPIPTASKGERQVRKAKAGAKPALRKKAKSAAPLNRKQKLEGSREAILQSALEQFGRDGFEGASLRRIAAGAGIMHGMIRHIYGSKEELWRQAITFLFERIAAELGRDSDDASGLDDREKIKDYIRRYVHYCARHPEHARIMIQQSILDGPELTWSAMEFIRARHMRDLPLLDRLKREGELPNVDTISLHFVIVGACQMIYLLAPEVRVVDGRNVFDPAAIERHADAVIGLLFR